MNLFWIRIASTWISFVSRIVLNLLITNTLICDCPVPVYVNIFVYVYIYIYFIVYVNITVYIFITNNIINTTYFIYYIINLFKTLLYSICIVKKEWKGFKGKTTVWTVHAIQRYFSHFLTFYYKNICFFQEKNILLQ